MLTERSARVATAVKLHRHVGRRRAGRFLAEGPNLVAAALARGLVREVFVTEVAARRHELLLAAHEASVHLVTERAAKALSDTVTPAGLVAVCDLPATRLEDVLAGSPQLIAVTVEIREPGNAGTVIRIADAMGAAAVILAGVEQTQAGQFALTYPRRLGFGLGSSVVSLSWRTGDDIVVTRTDAAHPVSYVNLDGVNSDAPSRGLQTPLTAIAANPSTVYVAGPQGVLMYSASVESRPGWADVPGLMVPGAAPVLPG